MLEKHIPFIKKQIAFYESSLKRGNGNQKYQEVLDNTKELLKDIESQNSLEQTLEVDRLSSASNKNLISKLPAGFFDNPLVITAQDIEGLPKDVIDELSDMDELEISIIDLLNLASGTLILDKIIAGLYHTTNIVHQRSQLSAKLYRMAKKGLIFSVPKKKGVYTTLKPSDIEGENEKA